jgi:hypothetical protein
MKHVLALLLPPLLALVACGGQTGGAHPGDGGAGADAQLLDGSPIEGCPKGDLAPGMACSIPDQSCSLTFAPEPNCSTGTTVTCVCMGGGWQCPDVHSSPCAAPCPDPTAVIDGQSCTAAPGLMCQSATALVPCAPPDAGPTSCTCQSSRWLCPADLAGVCAGDAGTGPEGSADGGDGG